MSRVPPSENELMWLIAQQREPAAVDEFLRRYPQHRAEMMRRLAMVRDLQGARPEVKPTRFQPRPVRRFGPPRWAFACGACIALGAIGFGSYALTLSLLPKPAAHQPTPPAASTSPAPVAQAPQASSWAPPSSDAGPPPDVASIQESPQSVYGRLVTLRVDRVRLSQAISLIEQGSGMRIEIAPGMPDPEIACDYVDSPALLVLRDMGRTVGFTALDQGDGSVLLIPAVDANATHSSAGGAGEDVGSNITPTPATGR